MRLGVAVALLCFGGEAIEVGQCPKLWVDSSGSHWITNALIAAVFPIVAQRSGAAPVLFFAAMMVVQFLVVLFVYPETKAATLEQLQEKLQR